MLKTLTKSTAIVGIAACAFSTQAWAKPGDNGPPDKNQGGPNIDCPAGTSLVAKFEWGNSYDFEKPAGNENVVTINNGTASGGKWTANQPISHVILKGGTETFTYEFELGSQAESFSKNRLPPNPSGKSPDISNIQFCTFSIPPSSFCQVYGVHDEGLNDSHLFTIDPDNNFQVAAFGEVCNGCDIEGLDTNEAGELYGSSGDDPQDPSKKGCLYNLNSGVATEVCQIANDEASAISFHPTDDSLWAWLENSQKLVKVNDLTPKPQGCDQLCDDVEEMFSPPPSDVNIEAMTWNLDGTVLYAADTMDYPNDNKVGPTQTVIWAATIPTMTVVSVEPLCSTAFEGVQIEALETLPDGRLMSGIHGGNDFWLFALDTNTCGVEAVLLDETAPIGPPAYSDVEGIAYCLP